MATPGLTPVVGTTPLRVSDAQARDDSHPPRQRRPTPRESTAAPDKDPDGERADSYTHDESARGGADDRAEQVRRVLERAMARAERTLSGAEGEDAIVESAPPTDPMPAPEPVVPVTPVTAVPSTAELTARYRTNAIADPPTHAIDRVG